MLLLPDDMQYFVEGSDEAMSLRLKWHTIAVNSNLPLFIYFHIMYMSTSTWFFSSLRFNFIRLLR